jgi:hypothetical protein
MKKWLWIFPLLMYIPLLADQHSLPEIRQLYKRSAAEESSCKQLVWRLRGYTEHNNPLMAGYRACGTMMMANYVWSPIEKLALFTEGKNLLEKCITRDPYNTELRFLRFAVQTNAPAFLNYNRSLEADKLFLLKTINQLKDKNLRRFIVEYLHTTELTLSEKQSLTHE